METVISEKSYAVEATYSNFYAGGDVAWSVDGKLMYCLNTSEICAVDVQKGVVAQRFTANASTTSEGRRDADELDEDIVLAFALDRNQEFLVSAHRSGLLRLWSLATNKVVKLWKGQHKGPIVKLSFSPCGKLVASSGSDSTLRIWDYANSRCLNVLKEFSGPALLVEFHPNAAKTEIYAAAADNSIYCWNYASKKLVHQLRGHLSQVTALSFENDGVKCRFLASSSRDKVLIVWDLSTSLQHKVIPMYEELVGVCFLSSDADSALEVVVASANGNLKHINCQTAKIGSLVKSVACEIRQLLHCPETQQLGVVTVEQNILVYKLNGSSIEDCSKQLIGFNDEILDLCLLGDQDRFLAVATNSNSIKIYDTAADMNCKIVAGHTNTVLTLSASGASQLLLSAGKDCSILLWQLQPETGDLRCVAKGASSHTSTIGCVAFGYNTSTVLASVSQDGSLKVWKLKQDNQNEYAFLLQYSALAHEKEVNCVTFAPNNKLIATASQDKTCKLWRAEAPHACIGTLRGHTRGVWCIRFSPVDQIALTSSADCSLRIWSLANMACLKRFEQECTVLRADFIDNGKFIVSAATDGLLKLWNIKTNACVQTLDEHSDRIWTLAISARSHKNFYSGGADSKLIRWVDVTEQCRSEEIDKRQAVMQQEQTLQSLLQQRSHMQKAFVLALTLSKPKITYNIISQFVRERDMSGIRSAIGQLSADQRCTLVEHVKAWSTNSRHSKVANVILHELLSDLIANPTAYSYNMSNLVEVLTPYVQRHFARTTELTKELAFLEFIVKCI